MRIIHIRQPQMFEHLFEAFLGSPSTTHETGAAGSFPVCYLGRTCRASARFRRLMQPTSHWRLLAALVVFLGPDPLDHSPSDACPYHSNLQSYIFLALESLHSRDTESFVTTYCRFLTNGILDSSCEDLVEQLPSACPCTFNSLDTPGAPAF